MQRIFRVVVLGLGLVASCRAVDDDWANLQRLSPGDQIQVVQTNQRSVEGVYRSSSPDELVLTVDGVPRTIARLGVVRISRHKKAHRVRNGILLGFAGVAIGGGIVRFGWACAETNDGCRNAQLATVGGGIGGAVIGASIPGGVEQIYRVTSLP